MVDIKKVQKLLEFSKQNGVEIIAVTKNRSVEDINKLAGLGVTKIGENKLQEALEKFDYISKNIEKHFIGRIQSNKLRKIVNKFDFIQSVDQSKYIKLINEYASDCDKIMPILLQINISNEDQKGGFKLEEIPEILSLGGHYKNIKICGLMTIVLNTSEEKVLRAYFSKMREIFDDISEWNLGHVDMKYLSMGMTNDYQLAIEEGSNMIRVGRGLFA